MLSTELFIYNTHTAGYLMSRFWKTHLAISLLASTDTRINLQYWEGDLSFCYVTLLLTFIVIFRIDM